MTFSKNSPPNASASHLNELLRMQRELQERTQRQLHEESKSSAADNEESDSLPSSSLRSFTAASEQLPMQREIQEESKSSVADNEESDSLFSSGLHSFPAAPRGSQPTSRSTDNVRSILNLALAILAESDEEPDDNVESSNSDDSKSQP